MEIKMVPLSAITPYENNPRKNADAVKYVRKSIEQFGFKVPMVLDAQNIIVCGHTRYLAAQEIGMEEVPCVYADDLSEEQIKAFRLADNKTAEMSGWDFDALEIELQDITGIDMSGFGFTQLSEEEENEVSEDEVPEVEETDPITNAGDLWILGEHRLLCGDGTSKEDVGRLVDGAYINMVFTDPPYGYTYQSNQRTKSQKFDVIKNDDKILDFFPTIKDVCTGFLFVCTTWKTADKWMEIFKRYYDLTNVIIWDKGGGGIGDLFHTFSTDYEMILVSNNGESIRGKRYGSVWRLSDKEIEKLKKSELLEILLEMKEYSSVWQIKKDNPNDYEHPTQKPVALSAKAIRSATDIGGSVLDVFGGSGSTLIVCQQAGRRCFMMELDERYCDVIVKRYINFVGSGEGVALIRDGRKFEYSEIERSNGKTT